MQVQAFRTKSEVDQWLFSNPMSCPGALHFAERNATVITYGIQTNSTPVERRGHYEDPTFKYQIPLQIAAEREIARSLIGGIISITNFDPCQCCDLYISCSVNAPLTPNSIHLRSKL